MRVGYIYLVFYFLIKSCDKNECLFFLNFIEKIKLFLHTQEIRQSFLLIPICRRNNSH